MSFDIESFFLGIAVSLTIVFLCFLIRISKTIEDVMERRIFSHKGETDEK